MHLRPVSCKLFFSRCGGHERGVQKIDRGQTLGFSANNCRGTISIDKYRHIQPIQRTPYHGFMSRYIHICDKFHETEKYHGSLICL
jgi:hypothetical protein